MRGGVNTGLSLVESDHVTRILGSHWLRVGVAWAGARTVCNPLCCEDNHIAARIIANRDTPLSKPIMETTTFTP